VAAKDTQIQKLENRIIHLMRSLIAEEEKSK
jgi:hypothetical protein